MSSDLYVIGLQEFVPLNIITTLTNPGEELVGKWVSLLLKYVNREEAKYVLISKSNMIGLCLIVLAREDVVKNISKPIQDKIRFGFNGILGNKGSLMLYMRYGNTPLCFFNCHFTHGHRGVNERMDQFYKVWRSVIKSESKEISVKGVEKVFVIGDLNFRLSLENEKCRELISENNIKELLKYDELWANYKKEEEVEIKEAQITFIPTYKYNPGTNEFDTSKKKRVPAWCDRIIWKNSEGIVCTAYNSCMNISSSDHKPLYGIYKVTITEVNKEAKEKVKESVALTLTDERINELSIADSEKFLKKQKKIE